MKKPVPQKYKDFVKDCCQKCAWNIGVSHFQIDIYYMDEPKEPNREEGVVFAEMKTDRRYLEGGLSLYPCVLENWKEGKIQKVKEIIFHEISHLATQHLYDVALATYKDEGEMKDAWETLTEVVSRLSLKIDELESR